MFYEFVKKRINYVYPVILSNIFPSVNYYLFYLAGVYSSSQNNVPFQRLYAASKLPSEFNWGYLIKRSRRSGA